MNKYIDIKDDVREALEQNRPVVALESTIISHGMPYPENVESARHCEELVREHGAVPATIAIINGRVKVGLTDEDLDMLGRSTDAIKVSRRDIPMVLAKGMTGATTVASTMIFSHLAGIKVFATGGIGGVHRGAETSFDISADLEELAMSDVCVVCAGAKSILDITLTLEYLETKGVPVIGYKTNDFPAFYTRTSGHQVHFNLDEKQIAGSMHAKWDLNLKGGFVVANPIPTEYEMEKEEIDKIIAEALLSADDMGIKGKEITPYLLDKIYKISEGRSLYANKKLVYNNAVVAAKIASEYSK